MFEHINKIGQKVSKVTKNISDINSIEQFAKGNNKPIKHKIKNKIKNKLFNISLK